MQLDHVTFRTRDIPGTRDFLCSLFDLTEGPRPQSIRSVPGCWLYADGKPIVHVIGSWGSGPDFGPDRAGEALDHVGFRLQGYRAFRARLDHIGLRYSTMDLADIGERRLFFRTPGGTLIEAVFAEPVPADIPPLPADEKWISS